MGKYIAIDIGGTNIKYGLIDNTDTLLEAHEIPTEAHKGGPEILRKVKGIVASYLEQTSVAGICISSAGMVDPDKGEIFMLALRFRTMQVLSSRKCWKKHFPFLVKLKMMSIVLVCRKSCQAAARERVLRFV